MTMKRIVLFSIMLALFSCRDGEKKGFADIVPDSDRTGIRYDSNGYGLLTRAINDCYQWTIENNVYLELTRPVRHRGTKISLL